MATNINQLETISHLFSHMAKCHPDAQYWGDSGTLDGSIQICFICGKDLAKDWRLLRDRISQLEQEKTELTDQWNKLQSNCSHSRLPKRELGDEYCDICPDCGYMVYCYSW